MEKVLDTYELEYNPKFPVVCMDESPKQIIDYKEEVSQDGTLRQDSEYIRLGVAEIFVAFEPLAGHREMTVEDDHKSDTWVKFMANLMDTTYKYAEKVTWVMDNFCTHKLENFCKIYPPEQAKAYLDRMEIVYTPVHGSWLNMAEIQFSVLTRQELDRPFASKQEVKEVVEKWKNKQNEEKKGVNWQFKTPNARIKLKKLYPTI